MNDKKLSDSELAYIKELPGFSRTDPQYFKDPMIDRLLEILLLMGGEFWAMRDRLMVLEHLLATDGRLTPDLIENFKPDESFTQSSAELRKKFIQQVFGSLYPQGSESKKDHFAWVTNEAKSKD